MTQTQVCLHRISRYREISDIAAEAHENHDPNQAVLICSEEAQWVPDPESHEFSTEPHQYRARQQLRQNRYHVVPKNKDEAGKNQEQNLKLFTICTWHQVMPSHVMFSEKSSVSHCIALYRYIRIKSYTWHCSLLIYFNIISHESCIICLAKMRQTPPRVLQVMLKDITMLALSPDNMPLPML